MLLHKTNRYNKQIGWFLLVVILIWGGCQQTPGMSSEKSKVPLLKGVFEDAFFVGAALNRSQITGEDAAGIELVKNQYNTITSENILKWENVHP